MPDEQPRTIDLHHLRPSSTPPRPSRDPQFFIHARLGSGRVTIAARIDQVTTAHEGMPMERLTITASMCAPGDNFSRAEGRARATRRMRHPLTEPGAETFSGAFLLPTPLMTDPDGAPRPYPLIAAHILGWFNRWLNDVCAQPEMPWWVWQGDNPGEAIAIHRLRKRRVVAAVTE